MTELKNYGDGKYRTSSVTVSKIRLLESEGLSTKEISEKLGIHRSTVNKYRLKKKGNKVAKLPDRKIRQIRKLRAEGLTTQEIMARVGVGKNSVLRYGGLGQPTHNWDEIRVKISELESQGIFSRKKQAEILGIHYNSMYKRVGPAKWYNVTIQDVQNIRKRYYGGETVVSLAKEHGVSTSTIYAVLNREGKYANI